MEFPSITSITNEQMDFEAQDEKSSFSHRFVYKFTICYSVLFIDLSKYILYKYILYIMNKYGEDY